MTTQTHTKKKFTQKLASVAFAAALIIGGSVATSSAAHAAPTTSANGNTAIGGYTASDKFWGTGATRYFTVCSKAVSAKKAHVIKSGGTNVKSSCARGVGANDRNLWYGVVTWHQS